MQKASILAGVRSVRYHPRAGIVCDNSESMADRQHAPYNWGRLVAPGHVESPAKRPERRA